MAADWPGGRDAGSDPSALPVRSCFTAQRFYSRSFAISRNSDKAAPSSPLRDTGPRNAHVHPSCHTFSLASRSHEKAKKCNPCVRYEASPMSPEAQIVPVPFGCTHSRPVSLRDARELGQLICLRTKPEMIYSDNGAGLTRCALQKLSEATRVERHLGQPGRPNELPHTTKARNAISLSNSTARITALGHA